MSTYLTDRAMQIACLQIYETFLFIKGQTDQSEDHVLPLISSDTLGPLTSASLAKTYSST